MKKRASDVIMDSPRSLRRERQSNMELLRIVAMFFIVVFHCSFKSGFVFEQLDPNTFGIKCFWMLGELGVNLFTLVSGYFQINGRFKSEKLIRLLCQVLFYWSLTCCIAIGLGLLKIDSIKMAFLYFFPTITGRYWYVTAFIIIYIFSPWLNAFLKGLGRKQFTYLLLVSLLIWCVIPTFFGMINNGVESMMFYTRLVWLAIIYAVGAYIRLISPRFLHARRGPLLMTLLSAVLLMVSIVLIAQYPGLFGRIGITEWAYFWPPNTILMFLLSIGFFGLFLNMKLPCNRIINRVASTTLGIYLLHDGALQGYFWHELFGAAQYQSEPHLILYILFAALLVFVAGMFSDLIRQWIERLSLDRFFASDLWGRVKGEASMKLAVFAEKIIGGE